MACTIVATPGSATATSYATIADADAYHESHPYATVWEDAGDDEKCRALVTATKLLDTWFDWFGIVTDLNQALLWPRLGVIKPGISQVPQAGGINDWHEPFAVFVDPHLIPARIKDATAELARNLLASNRMADSDLETQKITSLAAGPVRLTFGSVTAKPIPDAVLAMVTPLGTLRSKSGSGAVTMHRA